MKSYGLIGHYLSLSHFSNIVGLPSRLVELLPYNFVKRAIATLPPYKFLEIPEIISKKGKSAKGAIFIVPMFPEHAIQMEEKMLQKIVQACQRAESAGVDIVSLAGYTSVLGNEGEVVSRKVNLAVTSGNTLTAALAIRGLRIASQLMGIDWKNATVAIVGASGDIGSGCFRVISREVRKLILVARREKLFGTLVNSVDKTISAEIVIAKNVKDAISSADLILSATSALTTVIDSSDLKPGAVVCDVALPHSVGIGVMRKRNDVLVFDGGMAKLPQPLFDKSEQWYKVSPDGETVFGCLAEAMLLALEERIENYSIGRGNITPDRIYEMESLASIHGFELANFKYNGIAYSSEMIKRIRDQAELNRQKMICEMK